MLLFLILLVVSLFLTVRTIKNSQVYTQYAQGPSDQSAPAQTDDGSGNADVETNCADGNCDITMVPAKNTNAGDAVDFTCSGKDCPTDDGSAGENIDMNCSNGDCVTGTTTNTDDAEDTEDDTEDTADDADNSEEEDTQDDSYKGLVIWVWGLFGGDTSQVSDTGPSGDGLLDLLDISN